MTQLLVLTAAFAQLVVASPRNASKETFKEWDMTCSNLLDAIRGELQPREDKGRAVDIFGSKMHIPLFDENSVPEKSRAFQEALTKAVNQNFTGVSPIISALLLLDKPVPEPSKGEDSPEFSVSELDKGSYTTEAHGFGWALSQMNQGMRVTRRGWNGKGMWIRRIDPPIVGERSFLEMKTVTGETVPWVASQSDLLEIDWEVVL